ncbi:hypothetical protein ES288_D04G081400v1 [Gossypium darwinii]|uniref:Uncharacterized protein n=2 Tax=Gossypium TaxID=3633 RepID=A0A5D2LAI9_GOSTO|nr:hypothetical protein ES288_D04G081400v1 [Gossypium darwinii]TYH76381.1 hypothetical protein ES332_D04G081800v1 [Gossypium tomentosum]
MKLFHHCECITFNLHLQKAQIKTHLNRLEACKSLHSKSRRTSLYGFKKQHHN